MSVAWETACRSKDEGGLGIIDIKSQNTALLLKHLHKFYNHADIPWVKLTWNKLYANNFIPPHAKTPSGSFWWKDLLKLTKDYRNISRCNPGKGNSIMLWSDAWHDRPLKDVFPQLFSFARKPKYSITFFLEKQTQDSFFLPLSQQASAQLINLQNIIQQSILEPDREDQWTYIWGSNTFSSKRAYKCLVGTQEASPLFKWLWSAGNLGKHKIFFWILLRDRLNTRNLLKRKKHVSRRLFLCPMQCRY